MHSLNGNMNSASGREGGSKGKKGAGKDPIHDEEEMFRIDIRNFIPEAALMRSQPTLYAEDWNVPIRSALELSNVDGIAIVQKAQIAQPLRRVGYTRNAVAMLTTQSATQLHMKRIPLQRDAHQNQCAAR